MTYYAGYLEREKEYLLFQFKKEIKELRQLESLVNDPDRISSYDANALSIRQRRDSIISLGNKLQIFMYVEKMTDPQIEAWIKEFEERYGE